MLQRVNFNTVVALGIILLGAGMLWIIPTQIAEPPRFFGRSSTGLSPKLFPQIVAVAFIVLGVVYGIASLKMTEPNGFAGMRASAWVNLGVVLVAMTAYVLLLIPIGYVAASVLVAITISLYYGSRSLIGIGLVGIAAPFLIFYVFTGLLGVSLPPFPRF